MKSIVKAASVAVALIVPALSFAQTAQPLTRAEVRAEQAAYAKAGFNPARMNPQTWGTDVQAASARVAAQRQAAAETVGFGPSVDGTSQSGGAASAAR